MPADPLSRPTVLEALQALVATPSVNPSIAPDEPGGESAVAAVARDWLTQRGIRSWLEEAAPGRPNAVAEIGDGAGPTLVFCAHLDTVGTAGMTIPPFEPRVEGNRVYGRGSYDMKGSAAAILSAAAALALEKLTGRVLLALVADEEHASLGAQDFVSRHRADACVVTEPSEGRLILGHKGFVWIEIITRGRAAHGSRWDLGISAIGKMGRVIAALERFDSEQLRRRVHPLLGPGSQHCALVRGGTGISTYSESCRLQVERRTLPGETPGQVLEELREVVRAAGEGAEMSVVLDRPPLLCDPGSAIARSVREAAAQVTGAVPETGGVAYWMDAALFAAAGIPTVNYGPGGAGAHEAVEWVDLDSVVSCARVLTETARRFCRPSA
ncbi:MAG TPA: M20/M25/M40 family metallo-hydrolase [Candidatus Acidoferrales bacterium]|nr:M20/M25/M40 family metallo-hydrolase [Candidatus Acidoferrales bacterium]